MNTTPTGGLFSRNSAVRRPSGAKSAPKPVPIPRPKELRDTEREHMREAFQIFDSDRDGYLDAHELQAAMRACGFQPTKSEIMATIKQVDPEHETRISDVDYERVMTEKILGRDPEDEIQRMFELIDIHQTGSIGLDELKALANDVGESIPDDELRLMIDQFDWDEDGRLNYDEFRKVMAKFAN